MFEEHFLEHGLLGAEYYSDSESVKAARQAAEDKREYDFWIRADDVLALATP